MKPLTESLGGLALQGNLADDLLRKAGVVLTQGGEPTFVPSDTSAPEWNLAALGPEKLALAWRLCIELEHLLMPGALILKGNGKLYPGEPIPRWKLTLLRRKGNTPLWKDGQLLLKGGQPARTPLSPRTFLSALSMRLGLQGRIRPVYEDVGEAMRFAASLGESVPVPRYSRKSGRFVTPRWTREQRLRWESLHRTAGWILPLGREGSEWISDLWLLPNGDDITLLPGSSCIGLRLPLHRLPADTLSCALTAEIRDGALHLFLPPLPDAKAFADLLAAIEETLRELASPPVSLEGHEPPGQEGWESLTVIPDPGVIEVNLPPAASWNELERTALVLFRAAELAGLRGVRRLPSGEEVASGGGGHLVLGGPSLAENPFLWKPSLLPSFLRFIQHHPCLSYLFGGRFFGPSSQAPRIDESLFEIPAALERTLRHLESLPPPVDPGIIDFQLRNLLLDLHGNTHKAEVSVDKFFNPFLPNGRLGLVEFRAPEMSPDAPCFLALHALWRALAAAFATRPYLDPLTDWRERLHGEFLTPTRLMRDLEDVLTFLEGFGFSFRPEWFEPQALFRFPVLHETRDPVPWSLRRAGEPWPLLGEQPTREGSLVRCVDSSTERIEIRLEESRGIAVTVNARHLRMASQPDGSCLGTVRFRALDLPVRLHPQIAPHLPLLISLHDPATRRSFHWNYDRPHASGGSPTVSFRGETPLASLAAAEGSTPPGFLDLLDGN